MGELTADFRQYYSLDIDRMGIDYTVSHAACLVSQLPAESRVMKAVDERLAWGNSDYLLAKIADSLALISWQISMDDTAPRPNPMRRPGDPAAEKQGMGIKEYEAILSKPRKER